jgi:hypothetical protein
MPTALEGPDFRFPALEAPGYWTSPAIAGLDWVAGSTDLSAVGVLRCTTKSPEPEPYNGRRPHFSMRPAVYRKPTINGSMHSATTHPGCRVRLCSPSQVLPRTGHGRQAQHRGIPRAQSMWLVRCRCKASERQIRACFCARSVSVPKFPLLAEKINWCLPRCTTLECSRQLDQHRSSSCSKC